MRAIRWLTATAVGPLLPAAIASAQARGCGPALNLGVDCVGVSIGNSRRWTGLRLNFRDIGGIQRGLAIGLFN